jgi:hypothetical protein
MRTGFRGTFVICWSQTEVDGLDNAAIADLDIGSVWCWRGDAIRIDGPDGLLRLDGAQGEAELRRRAAGMVRRLVGAALTRRPAAEALAFAGDASPHPMADNTFVVTDGARSFTVTLIETAGGRPPLLMFLDSMPPRDSDLYVVRHSLPRLPSADPSRAAAEVICFTPGTRIATPRGPRPVEDLVEGDRVATKDDGPQEILWIGRRHIGGARLFAMPALRPVRIGAGALALCQPERSLLVSPAHRLVVRGARARALFNTPEVLVAARDLVDGRQVRPDQTVREVDYIHLLLPRHEVLWANGVETESFHPASTRPEAIAPEDRARLFAGIPEAEADPFRYGPYARRTLSRSEAALLFGEAA